MTRRMVALAFLVVGIGCLGLRTIEYLTGGFVGEASLAGSHLVVVDLPLVPLGLVAVVVAGVLLPSRSRPHQR